MGHAGTPEPTSPEEIAKNMAGAPSDDEIITTADSEGHTVQSTAELRADVEQSIQELTKLKAEAELFLQKLNSRQLVAADDDTGSSYMGFSKVLFHGGDYTATGPDPVSFVGYGNHSDEDDDGSDDE